MMWNIQTKWLAMSKGRYISILNEIKKSGLLSKKPLKERTREDLLDEWELKQQSREESVPLEYVESCIDLVTEAYFDEGTVIIQLQKVL